MAAGVGVAVGGAAGVGSGGLVVTEMAVGDGEVDVGATVDAAEIEDGAAAAIEVDVAVAAVPCQGARHPARTVDTVTRAVKRRAVPALIWAARPD